MKLKKCPNCESENLSNGENDYLIIEGREVLIQFCNDCQEEWFVEEKLK